MKIFSRRLPAILLAVFLAALAVRAAEKPQWELVWSDEFNGSQISGKNWTKIKPGPSDWNKHMSSDASLFSVKNGMLTLRGKVNPNKKKGALPFITGGISSQGKFSFCRGKIEIRAKLDCAQGAWPALWLLPEKGEKGWPADGEIDLMEHLNFDDFAYQTVHSHYATALGKKNPPPGGTGKIKKKGFNIYGLEWHKDKLVFLINGKETFTYPRLPEFKNEGQWPFTKPFYILIDMQLGGNWVGAVDSSQLPVEMTVDWVRVYRDASDVPAKKKK